MRKIKTEDDLVLAAIKVTVLIVEQKVREVLEICHHIYSIKLGKVAFEGSPADLKHDKAKLKQLFL